LHLLVCVQGVVAAPRVRQRSQRDVHEGSRCGRSCLRHFCYHVLRKFPCVGGSLSLSAVWALAPGLERRRVRVPFLDAGGRARPILHVHMRWYTAVGLHTMQGILDKLRELTHYDHGTSAVNQALHSMQDNLQGTNAIMYLYR